jgi:hypothetical protein
MRRFEYPPQMSLEFDTATFTWWHTDGTRCPEDCLQHDWSSPAPRYEFRRRGPFRRLFDRLVRR